MPTISFRNEDKQSMSIAERVKMDKVKEYWVQRYIVANYTQLGFEALEGPFNSGPDFRMRRKGKWVMVEAEIAYEDYITHKHHEDLKWASCAILIVLSEKKPNTDIFSQFNLFQRTTLTERLCLKPNNQHHCKRRST
jgi:hypothetical protein